MPSTSLEIVRALDEDHDWTFGQGLNDYNSGNLAVGQDIDMSLKMFLGDCFFATSNGLDWFNLLGGKNLLAVQLAVNAGILNVQNVTGILNTRLSLDVHRNLNVTYLVQSVFGKLQNTFVYDVGTVTAGVL